MNTTEPHTIAVGDRVREAAHRVPKGCKPFEGRVLFIASDGWVGVNFRARSFSFPPGEVELINEERA